MPPFQSVAPSTTAFLDLPLGFRYHRLNLLYGGTTFAPANMTQIRVIANNQNIFALSGTQVDGLNQFDKWPAASANKVLTLHFEKPAFLRDHMQIYYTALNTIVPCKQAPMGITALRVEIDINAAASAPTLAAYADVSDNNPDQAKALWRREVWLENVAAIGEYLHLHRYNGDPLRPVYARWALWDTSANITNFRMLMNGQELVNRAVPINTQMLSGAGFKAPQNATFVCYDTEENGNYANRLKIGNIADFQLRSTHAATNASLNVTADSYGVLAG